MMGVPKHCDGAPFSFLGIGSASLLGKRPPPIPPFPMAFDLENYRISLEGLRILMVELEEIHDTIRDLCTEPPSQLHRATLASFGGDLGRAHRRAEISLAAIQANLREDKASIRALAKCYRSDHYVYGKGKAIDSLPDDLTSSS